MIRRDQQHQRRIQHLEIFDTLILGRKLPIGDDQIQFSAEKQLIELILGVLFPLKHQLRAFRLHLPEGLADPCGDVQPFEIADVQGIAEAMIIGLGGLHGILKLLLYIRKQRIEILSGPGHGHIVVGALEQLESQILLQLRNIFTHRLLGHKQLPGCLRKAQGLAQGHKALDRSLIDHGVTSFGYAFLEPLYYRLL